MLGNYTLNEELKRFEPKDDKCIYCKVENMQNINECYFTKLYLEGNRTNILVYRSVNFSKLEVGIPRCKTCLMIHKLSREKVLLFSWLAAFFAYVVAILIFDIFGAIFGLLVAMVIGIIVFESIKNSTVKKKGILTEKEGAESVELVQNLIISGWTFNEPHA